jgi:DNA-binding beta-propeller fold protein YncE
MRYIIYGCLFILVFFITTTTYSENVIELCDECTYSIFYDNQFESLITGCVRVHESYINYIDPSNNETYAQFMTDGYIHAVKTINDCGDVIVLLSECDYDEKTQDSKIQIIDFDTGTVVNEVYIDDWCVDMAVDSNEEFAYVTKGISNQERTKLQKYQLPQLQLVDEIEVGFETEDVVISQPANKVYVHNIRTYDTWSIDPVDLSIIVDDNYIGHGRVNLKMGYDDRLFISRVNPDWRGNAPCLFVIDTCTDEIIESFDFGDIGIGFMAVNPVTHKLYGAVSTKTYARPEDGELVYELSNQIIELDLDDYSYRIFTVGNERLYQIALAYKNGMNRLYCLAWQSNNIHYIDVE